MSKPSDVQAEVTDQRVHLWKFRTDRYGGITEFTTALGHVSTVLRNADGLPYEVTEPKPDTAGPLAAPVTRFGYNDSGDMTLFVAAEGGTTRMTYTHDLHRIMQTIDPVGRTQTFTYDTNGNLVGNKAGSSPPAFVALRTISIAVWGDVAAGNGWHLIHTGLLLFLVSSGRSRQQIAEIFAAKLRQWYRVAIQLPSIMVAFSFAAQFSYVLSLIATRRFSFG